MTRSIPSPQFGLEEPAGVSDEMVVVELEREGNALLGPYNNKESISPLWNVAPMVVVSTEVFMRWGLCMNVGGLLRSR
jgi:hypothetical protein